MLPKCSSKWRKIQPTLKKWETNGRTLLKGKKTVFKTFKWQLNACDKNSSFHMVTEKYGDEWNFRFRLFWYVYVFSSWNRISNIFRRNIIFESESFCWKSSDGKNVCTHTHHHISRQIHYTASCQREQRHQKKLTDTV